MHPKLHWFFSQRKCVCYSVCASHRKDNKNIQNVIKYIYKKYEWHVQSSWFFWKLFKNSLLWRRYCRRLTSYPVSIKNQYQLEIRPQWWMMMNFSFIDSRWYFVVNEINFILADTATWRTNKYDKIKLAYRLFSNIFFVFRFLFWKDVIKKKRPFIK